MSDVSRCPLCGAHIPPAAWLDACDELLDPALGLLATHCPACQGNLELLPGPDRLELGFRNGKHFEAARNLDFPGLRITLGDDRLSLACNGREWNYSADD